MAARGGRGVPGRQTGRRVAVSAEAWDGVGVKSSPPCGLQRCLEKLWRITAVHKDFGFKV